MMEQPKQEGNEAPLIDINFNLIRNWIKEHLKEEKRDDGKNLIRSESRTVVVNAIDGPVRVDIPTKEDPQAWAAAWVSVYETSLDALEAKVKLLANKGGYVRKTSKKNLDKLIVGDRIISLPEDINSISYANALENIIKEAELYETKMLEKNVEKPAIVVNCSQVVLDAPGEALIQKTPSVKSKTALKQKVAIKTTPGNSDVRVLIGQKISDNEKIDEVDCSNLRGQAFVLATWQNKGKGEDLFYNNCEMLKENLPSVPLGAFISGKSTSPEQVVKEGTKIEKTLREIGMTGPIVYEVNNEYIKENANEPAKVIATLDIAEQITDILSKEQYKTLICMDFEVSKIVNKISDEGFNHISKYPQIVRILPREKDAVDPTVTAIIMDPQYDHDQVIVKDSNIIDYFDTKESPQSALNAA